MWRSGGAGDLDPKALDEELDFLAAQLSTSVGDTTGSVNLNLLSKDLDRGLQLLMAVLQKPRFETARLAKAKEDLIADLKRRNDETADIESREWNRLVYGDDFWINRLATKASVDGIGQADLVALHTQLANPANFVVAVAGDFKRDEMLAQAQRHASAPGRPPGPGSPRCRSRAASARPGVYLVDKKDVNQGRISMGHMGSKRPLGDEAAIEVANDILGGGGFTAWMMKRVRSDEGLAYGAYSNYGIGDLMPGVFRAYVQTKSATCARATTLTRELMVQAAGGRVHPQGARDQQGLVHRDAAPDLRDEVADRAPVRRRRAGGPRPGVLADLPPAHRGRRRRRPRATPPPSTSSRTSSSS